MHIQQIILTIFVATIGGMILNHFKLPGALLLGSILCAAAYGVITEQAYMAPWIKVFAQTITGAYIGSLASRDDIAHLPRVTCPLIEVMAVFLIVNLLCGYLITLFSPIDLCTGLLASMPGGVSDAVLISMDMGADVTKVAVMQLVRLFFGIGMLPFIVRFTDKALHSRDESIDAQDSTSSVSTVNKESPIHWTITIILIAAAGISGKLSGIPAGTMLFSMIAMMLIRMKLYENIAPPKLVRQTAQILIGAYVGASVTRREIAELPYVIVPIVIMLVLFTAACILMGLRLKKRYGFGLKEGMLCQSPAGVTEMALIAADMGIESTNLVVIQIGRMIVVMGLFPQIIAFLSSLV